MQSLNGLELVYCKEYSNLVKIFVLRQLKMAENLDVPQV